MNKIEELMTIRTVVRNTRGLAVGDIVARLMPDGEADSRAFRINVISTGLIDYHDERHLVYLLDGTVAPFGKQTVTMIVTENVPWCVSR